MKGCREMQNQQQLWDGRKEREEEEEVVKAGPVLNDTLPVQFCSSSVGLCWSRSVAPASFSLHFGRLNSTLPQAAVHVGVSLTPLTRSERLF